MRKNTWYQRCRAEIERLYGDDADLFCDLLAATSPRKQVKANWKLAEKIYEYVRDVGKGKVLSGLWTGLLKFDGAMPCHVGNIIRALTDEPLSGRKVSAFAANLKGDLDQVTVDVWTARFFGYEKITKSVYDKCEASIRCAAYLHGIKPAEMQAQIWCLAMLAAGRTPKSFLAAINCQMEFSWKD